MGDIKYIVYIQVFDACLIMILNALKLLFIKKLYGFKLAPYSLFMINSSVTDMMVGFMVLIVACVDNHNRVTYGNLKFDSLLVAKCGLFTSLIVSLTHVNVYEVFRMQIVAKPFLRKTVSKTTVYKFIGVAWFIGILFAILLHVGLNLSITHIMVDTYENLVLSCLVVTTIPTLTYSLTRIHSVIRKRKTSMAQLIGGRNTTAQNEMGGSIEQPKMRKETGICTLIIFAVSWLPFVVCSVLQLIGLSKSKKFMRLIHEIVNLFPHFNFVWNAIVYINCLVSDIKKHNEQKEDRRVRLDSFYTERGSS